MSNPQRDGQLPSRGLMIAGAIVVLIGIMVLASRPAEVEVGAPGWFDNESTRGDRFLIAFALAALGAITMLAGLITRRPRRPVAASAPVAVVTPPPAPPAPATTGPIRFTGGERVATPAARLESLEELRRRGLVDDREYQLKRNQILARL